MEGGGGGRPATDDCVESEYVIVWQYDTNTGLLLILEMIIVKYIQTMLLTATSSSFNRVAVSYQAVAIKLELCPEIHLFALSTPITTLESDWGSQIGEQTHFLCIQEDQHS